MQQKDSSRGSSPGIKNTMFRRGQKLAASTLAAMLAFTLAPVSASWAEEAGTSAEAPTATPAETPEGPVTEEEGAAPEAENSAPGIQPLANSEDVPDLGLQVRIAADGTETWDADSDAGNDSGPNNGIVRVNDTVRYEVEYAVSGKDAQNLVWAMTFPKGMELTQIPGYCQAGGSSLVPATAGNPSIPLSANSINELSEQKLTCVMGNRSVATDKVFVTAKVLNLAHQGMNLSIVDANITAEGVETPIQAATLPTVKASARLMWDISKNAAALSENSGYIAGPLNETCPHDPTRICKYVVFPVLVSALAGGKGAMPAIGDVTFVDNVAASSLYPQLSSSQQAAIDGNKNKYGAVISAVPSGIANGVPQPFNKVVGTANVQNSVRDGGSTVFSQAGPGEPALVRISNADWSLRTYPSTTASGAALPQNVAYAYSQAVKISIPVDTVVDFGVNISGSQTLRARNVLTDFTVQGFTANDIQRSANQPGPNSVNEAGIHWNDYRWISPRVDPPGPFTKYFAGVPGEPGTISATSYGSSGAVEGPPGGATLRSGSITVAPTQNVISMLVSVGNGIEDSKPVSRVACDVWDNTKLHLRAANIGPSRGVTAYQQLSSDGAPVWVSSWNGVYVPNSERSAYATSSSAAPAITVEYSNAAASGSGADATCGNSIGTWYNDPADVPGNDPALAASGIYSGVSRVRVHHVIPAQRNVQTANGQSQPALAISISMQVANSGYPSQTILPNWATVKQIVTANAPSSASEVLNDPGSWSANTYDPAGHSGTGGDRLILAHAQVRIDKQVRKGDSGGFSSTPPQVTGGDLVQYRLSPALTSGAMTPGILKDVWVEDCLPASQTYASASIDPAVVSPGSTPADAKRAACASGDTYIRWVIPQHEVNTVIDPIILSVDVSPTADDGTYNNTVQVWAQDDASTVAQRSSQAQIQISNIAGIKLEKIALTPVVQVNRTGQSANELNKWLVRMSNTLPASAQSGVTNPDVIDVLPKQGDHGTSFSGSFTFVNASVTKGGAQTRILYTKAANVSANPEDGSNSSAGATAWCDAPGGNRVSGLGACPATAAEVTGLRVQRPGAYNSGDVIEIELSMVGVNNTAGDVYVNRAMAAAEGLDNPVGPIRREERAISSSIGDYVWWDFNRNGIQDLWQGDDEQPASGIAVALSGVDDLGNQVSLTATTSATGKYEFAGLRSSNSDGYVVTFTKPDGSSFTTQHAGTNRAMDSNANTDSGVADAIVLGRNVRDLSVDAGLLPIGGVQINKALTGVGAGTFAASDTLKFQVVCAFDPQLTGVDPTEVLNQEVALNVNGAAAVTSEVMAGLPAFTSCTITETDHGSADSAAAPVTVIVPWDADEEKSGTAIGSLTNFVSAGSVQVSKTLAGDDIAVEAAKNKVFEILTTCQIEEQNGAGDTVRSDIYSGVVKIKGGQTKYLVGDDDEPRLLPLNARCFGEELNTGGATLSTVDYDTWERSVPVDEGAPEELQVLTISAVNTFENAQLVVSKKVVGPGTGGYYDFELACTIPGESENGATVDGEYALPDADARFRLKDGESRVILVPAGVSCQVVETNIPNGAKVSFADSDDATEGGATDGIVTNLSGLDNTVKVLNTFPERAPLALTGGQMLGAAALIGAGLLLIGGALFFLRRRRSFTESSTVHRAV